MEAARQEWQKRQQRSQPAQPPVNVSGWSKCPRQVRRVSRPLAVPVHSVRPQPTALPTLTAALTRFQTALPGSPGEAYLRQRGIPLAVARQVGVGYATHSTWLHRARDWRGGRLVFPHTTPAGDIVSLYGRAVGDNTVPKGKRHDHLPRPKGYFNAPALMMGDGPVFVCEGAFDALSLMAAGYSRVIAIFGIDGWRWEWARPVRELVLALDADTAGQRSWANFARQAILRGKRVAIVPPEAYGGWKDVNEAWVAGVLRIGD